MNNILCPQCKSLMHVVDYKRDYEYKDGRDIEYEYFRFSCSLNHHAAMKRPVDVALQLLRNEERKEAKRQAYKEKLERQTLGYWFKKFINKIKEFKAKNEAKYNSIHGN